MSNMDGLVKGMREIDIKDVEFTITRPEAEPSAYQVDALPGDLYLGERTFYGYKNVTEVKNMARKYLRQIGSLN